MEPFLSEIRIMAINYAPQGWAKCNGQFLPINQNQALFALLGTTYGGNGQTTFALPDLRDKVPVHVGGGFNLGQTGGEQAHTLTAQEMPTHVHQITAAAPPHSGSNTNVPTGNFLSNSAPAEIYSSVANASFVALSPGTVSNVGGNQPHTNMQPYLALNFIIALQGIFPTF
jgi:microcystin-dependent protein